MKSNNVFSDEWALAWATALNGSQSYRQAAANWRWPLVMVVDGVVAWRLDLYEGTCRSVRRASEQDLKTSDYVIAGPIDVWNRILSNDIAPLVAIMQGSLRLERGSYAGLARYARAAREMLAAAIAISPTQNAASRVDEAGTTDNGPTTEARPEPRHVLFQTTSSSGLDHDSFPMRLYHKAKKLGVWDPTDLDFTQDLADWSSLTGDEKDVLLRLVSMFQAGEEAVTLDLLPLIRVVASEGRLEEEMYLTTFLFEEAKHTEFFRRFMDEVVESTGELDRYHTPSYRRLFYEELPKALNRLDADASPRAQIEAAVTYNMVVEGTLAETGYHGLYEILDLRGILPGLKRGTGMLQRDESRHIAYGVFLISRLIQSDGRLMAVFQQRMNELLPLATAVVSELFAPYDPMPFELREEDFLRYAVDQFGKRMRRIESGATPVLDP
jgi:ribonucleoside-diphosphate reductase beta chain